MCNFLQQTLWKVSIVSFIATKLLFCAASQCIPRCGSVNIRFPLPGGGDASETPSAKKHPLPVAKGTLAVSTIKCVNSTSTQLQDTMYVVTYFYFF